MKDTDAYAAIAENHDYMIFDSIERKKYFEALFAQHAINSVLDCACGTGSDLLLFHSLGLDVYGSDLSEAMLKVAASKIKNENISLPIKKVDFHALPENYNCTFDAVVCLSNAINEIDIDVDRALQSFKKVINDNGIIVFDQGQTDYSLIDPPSCAPVVNNRDFTRLFTMKYDNDIMNVNVYDFKHDGVDTGFAHSEFNIRIRRENEWREILERNNLEYTLYGSWNFEKYDKKSSERLIVVAEKMK